MGFNSANVGLAVSTDVTNVLDLATVPSKLDYVKQVQYSSSGAGLNQADKVFHDTRTLTASSNEDLDLAGVLVDAFGVAITFARIKTLIVRADPLNINNVVVGGAAANGFINWVSDPTDKIVVKPGGLFMLAAPDATAYAVTAATGDLLRVANSSSGSSVNYDIVLIGSST